MLSLSTHPARYKNCTAARNKQATIDKALRKRLESAEPEFLAKVVLKKDAEMAKEMAFHRQKRQENPYSIEGAVMQV